MTGESQSAERLSYVGDVAPPTRIPLHAIFTPLRNHRRMAAALFVKLAAGCGGSDGPVIANHRVKIEATGYQDFSIDDEVAFAAEVEKTDASPVATNPAPTFYNTQSILTANVSGTNDQSFQFNLKTEQ